MKMSHKNSSRRKRRHAHITYEVLDTKTGQLLVGLNNYYEIADAINDDKKGTYKNFKFSNDELEELSVAGWLHDFGKVATPEHVMNKSTKLEGLFDKIANI